MAKSACFDIRVIIVALLFVWNSLQGSLVREKAVLLLLFVWNSLQPSLVREKAVLLLLRCCLCGTAFRVHW